MRDYTRRSSLSVLHCFHYSYYINWKHRPVSLQQYRTWTAARAAGIVIKGKGPTWILHHKHDVISNDTSPTK